MVLLLFKPSIHLSLLSLLRLEPFVYLALDLLDHIIHLALQMIDFGLHSLLELILIDAVTTLCILVAVTVLHELVNLFFDLLIRLSLLLQDHVDAFVNLHS